MEGRKKKSSTVLAHQCIDPHSSSRLSSLPLQISHARDPSTGTNAKHPRDPPQPVRQNRAEVESPPGLFQPIEHPRRQRLFRLPVRIVDLERGMDVRDGVDDGPEAGGEPVLVEAVAEPGACVGDSARVLDFADAALEGDGLQT